MKITLNSDPKNERCLPYGMKKMRSKFDVTGFINLVSILPTRFTY
jgi:hypothetical protein